MSLKKIALGVGIVAVVGYFLLKTKGEKWAGQFKNIKISPVAFKNLNGKWNDFKPFITFDLDIKFTNPTPQSFNANGVIVTLKRILFYDKNNLFLGGSDVNISALNIPANSSTILTNIPVVLDVQSTALTVMTLLNTGNFNVNEIKTEAIISVLGLEYKISQ